MRILGVLYLVFLVQGDVGTFGSAGSADGGDLARRKRSWSWSSSNKVTQRPIGWNFDSKPAAQYPRQQYVQPQQYPQYVPQQQSYYTPVTQRRPMFSLSFGRPTKSLTRQLVKAAVAGTAVGVVSAYVKPVRPSTKSPAEKAAARERRRQERLAKRSTTTAIPEAGNSTTTPVPLADSELIPVMVQDANNLLSVVYVRRDKIPPGGIPIAMQGPFPTPPTPGQQTPPQQQPQQPQPLPVTQPQLQAPLVNSTLEVTTLPTNS